MDSINIQNLTPVYRVALGSARAADRPVFAALFSLDVRLGRAVSEASEPIIAQLKLAWWRDRFTQTPDQWPVGEPLLAQLAHWGANAACLCELVNGWEELAAGDALAGDALDRFCAGRSASWEALARVVETQIDARTLSRWADAFSCADLAERSVGLPGNKADLLSAREKQTRLPRELRPFAVLGTLGRRALSKDRPMLDGIPGLALALRTGLVGR